MHSMRAGGSIQDYCRACKTDRTHTIVVVDGDGQPLRVNCDYCESQHNYRGGPRIEPRPGAGVKTGVSETARPAFERTARPMPLPESSEVPGDLESLLRRIIREEAGLRSEEHTSELQAL